jgi:prepilin-type N-terminal cleavage/methylation domain-containing protein
MKKGFTLIEMAVVLLLIGILAGIVLRNIGGQSIQARDQRRVADLRNTVTYLAQYMAKYNKFPDVSNWSDLSKVLKGAGIITTDLPKPPSGDYEYFPCSDVNNLSEPNHFILRAQLEQTASSAPAVYKDSYDDPSIPSGWTCQQSSGSSIDCSSSKRYYCVIQ